MYGNRDGFTQLPDFRGPTMPPKQQKAQYRTMGEHRDCRRCGDKQTAHRYIRQAGPGPMLGNRQNQDYFGECRECRCGGYV